MDFGRHTLPQFRYFFVIGIGSTAEPTFGPSRTELIIQQDWSYNFDRSNARSSFSRWTLVLPCPRRNPLSSPRRSHRDREINKPFQRLKSKYSNSFGGKPEDDCQPQRPKTYWSSAFPKPRFLISRFHKKIALQIAEARVGFWNSPSSPPVCLEF